MNDDLLNSKSLESVTMTRKQLNEFRDRAVAEALANSPTAEKAGGLSPVRTAEQVQWKNIQKVVAELATFCFGGPDWADSISCGSAYIALANSLTAKDGLKVQLEPLPTDRQPAADAARLSAAERAEFIEQVVVGVAEIPDRDSPDDQPEMMLVTCEELRGIIESAFETADERARPTAVMAGSLPTMTEQQVADMLRDPEILTELGHRALINGDPIDTDLPWLTRVVNRALRFQFKGDSNV